MAGIHANRTKTTIRRFMRRKVQLEKLDPIAAPLEPLKYRVVAFWSVDPNGERPHLSSRHRMNSRC
jgi:hypothetical protein